MRYCGVWHTKRRLVARVVDEYGTCIGHHRHVDRTTEDFWNLLVQIEAQHGLDLSLVLTDELVQSNGAFAQILGQRGCDGLVAPAALVRHLRVLAVPMTRAPPHHLALLLARLPLCGSVYHRLSPLGPYLHHDIL